MRRMNALWMLRWLTAVVAVALLAGCGSDAATTLASLALDPVSAQLEVGAQRVLHATGTYSDGHTADVTAQAAWTSSAAAIASVGAHDGTARGIAPGQATVTAALAGIQAHALLTVRPARVLSLAVTPAAPIDLPVGLTRPFTATGTHADGTTVDLTADAHLRWSSAMPAIATISTAAATAGIATGIAEGATDIGATYDDGVNPAVTAPSVALHVTLTPLVTLSVEPASASIAQGYAVQLRLIGMYGDLHVEDLTGDARTLWSSDTPAVATVANDTGARGLATAVGPGDAVLRASYGGLVATASLHVSDATLAAIAVTPAQVTVTRPGSVRLHATGVFSDGTTQDLSDVATWTSSDTSSASVSSARGSAGAVTVPAGASTGPVVITAVRGAISSRATVTVNTSLALHRIDLAVDQSLLPVGMTVHATAVGTYTDGVTTFARDITDLVAWSATGTATVHSGAPAAGLVTGMTAGAASLGASLDGVSATALPLTVTGCPLHALAIADGPSLTMPRGTERRLSAIALYDTSASGCDGLGTASFDVSAQSATVWSSTNTAALTVDNASGSQGLVRAATVVPTPATADVQVRLGALTASAHVTVADACVRAVAIYAASGTIPAGVDLTFRATGTMSDGTIRSLSADVAWVSANNAVASVDAATGVVHGNAPGTTTLTAQPPVTVRCAAATGGTFALTVNDATITGVAVQPSVRQLSRGEHAQLRAIGTFSDQRSFDLTRSATWSSSNAGVALVDRGIVLASTATDGTAIVTAAFGNRDGFATVAVNGARLQRIALGVAPSYPCGTSPSGAFPVGARVPLAATGFYSDGTSRALTAADWTGSSDALPVERYTGIVAALGAGSTGVRATVGSVVSDPFTVTAAAAPVSALLVNPPSGWQIALGSQLQFGASASFDGFAGSCPVTESVTWTSAASAPAALSIGSDGYAWAGTAGAGAATVRATLGAVSTVSAGTVRGACVDGLLVDPRRIDTPVGVRVDARAYLRYSDGTRVQVAAEWSTANAAVARAFNALDVGEGEVGAVVPLNVGTTALIARLAPPTGAVCPGVGPVFTAQATLVVGDERLASISVDCTSDPTASRCNFGDSARPSYPAGLTFGCTAYGYGTAGTQWDLSDTVAWSSTDPHFVQVSDTAGTGGQARGVTAGSAVVVATLGAISGARTVTVNAATLQAITITPGDISLPAGFTQRFGAAGTFALPGAARRCDVTQWSSWSSNDTSAVVVGNTGSYRAMGWMLAAHDTPVTVTASLLGRAGTATVTVNHATLATIAVVPSAAQVGAGLRAQFAARGRYSDGSERDVTDSATWSTGDSSVAGVSNAFGAAGLAVGITPGSTVVRAQIAGVVGEARFAVTSACVQRLSVAVDDGFGSRPSRVPATFTARATYSDGFVADVTAAVDWSSSDDSVMPAPRNVDGTFTATSRAAGVATVIAGVAGCTAPVTSRVQLAVTGATLCAITLRGASGTDSTPVNLGVQFNAYGVYSDGTAYPISRAVDAWSLGNAAVAALGDQGIVVGRAVGTSTLTATQGSVSGATTVTVTDAALLSLRVAALNLADVCRDPADPASYVDTATAAPVSSVTSLRAWGTFSDHVVRDLGDAVVWTSSDPSVAIVFNMPSVRGMVFDRAAGTTVLRATANGGGAVVSGDLTLTVRDGTLGAVALNPGGARTVALASGNATQLALVGDYGAAGRFCVGANATWTTSNAAVAAVDRGRVDAVASGSATITGSIGPLSDTLGVVVGAPTLAYVEVAPAVLTVVRASTSRFRALAHYSDGSVNDVSANASTLWSSRDVVGSAVVWIDPGTFDRGVLWALNPGQARIDACLGTVCASTGTDRSALATVTP